MQTLNELYIRLVKAAAENRTQNELEEIQKDEFNPYQLDCLLHPKKYASVWTLGSCDCAGDEKASCAAQCIFSAIRKDEQGNAIIDSDLCAGCSECIKACKSGNLTGSKDILPALEAVKNSEGPVYAMIAPAFIGQFSQNVTPGKLRGAFKEIGFAGMVEVALFADILTLKEALEFDRKILDNKDYMITSCCCPIWIAMIRKVYHQFIPHVPGAVSPMVACGRSIKLLEPDSTTVFIGPCLAKKAEARERDIADAVDFVLTFEEIRDIFDAFHIDPSVLEDDHRDHSSKSGRIYARTGGISEAVQNTVNKLNPNRGISVKAQQADGIPACKEMMNSLREGKITANFLEGMGCVGGCVGGPKAILNREEGRDNVNQYGSLSAYETPADNPFVLELLKRLGLGSVESLLENTKIFTRNF